MHSSLSTVAGAVTVAILLLVAAPGTEAAYSLTKDYSGERFFDGWSYYGHYDNLTNGDIDWVNKTDSSDLTYMNAAGNAIIKADNTSTVLYPNKRRSVRIQSNDSYGIGSMWVFDFLHVPYGCSVWPAAWSQAANWPQGGEIDTFEGVNLQSTNQMALHTDSGCMASTSSSSNSFTGNLTYDNCDHDANSNSGCTVVDQNPASYGEAFAAAGGGVWATALSSDGIKIWFFSRPDVPSDLLASNSSAVPNPDNWGTPTASYASSSCNIADYFAPQHLVLDITACGDWAGAPSIINQTCPVTTNLCYTSFVLNSTNFDTAYFEIPSIRVYYDEDRAAESSAQTTSSSTSPAGSAVAAASSPAGQSSSGGQNGAAGLTTSMAGSVVALIVGAAVGAWTLV
ncbi:hypothetical protein JCM11251_006174 [Rhodosporidiobolus azoricus]